MTKGRIPVTAVYRRHGNPAKEMPSARRQAFFVYFFVAAWTKSKASGGTPPAGFAFIIKE
jgi:hypothetical protein